MPQTLKESLAATEEGRIQLEEARLIVEVTDLISKRLKEAGMKKSDLAAKLGKTKPYITQLLDGSANMTLRTVARVFCILGLRLRIEDVPMADEKVVALPDAVPTNYQLLASGVKVHVDGQQVGDKVTGIAA